MYLRFFGLNEKPFAITPDPRYLYLSERHAEALAHLLYGINESGGFIQLTGEVGTGKTTVVRTLLSRVPHHADVAVILNPRVTPVEFLLTICEELGLGIADADRDSVKQMVDALNRRLLAAHAEGRRIIVIVDEAQNLSAEVLEQVRLLTNLETPTQKLLQIILIGQPELRELLDRTDLRQLAQRITGRYHLEPLSREETRGYVRHRLRVAGAAEEIFTPAALARNSPLVGGHPARDQCDLRPRPAGRLHPGDAQGHRLAGAARGGEVYGRRFLPAWLGWLAAALGLAGLAGIAAFGWLLWQRQIYPLARRRQAGQRGARPRAGGTPGAHRRGGRGGARACRRIACADRARACRRVHQRLARRQQRQHQRCGRLPPPAVAVGNGHGGRQGPVRAGGQGGTILPGAARLLGASQSLEPAGHPDADRRSRTAAPRGVVRAWTIGSRH